MAFTTQNQNTLPALPDLVTAPFTQEAIERDINYYKAQKVAEEMLKRGLISLSEFNKLTQINRDTFSPYLVEIMPDIC